MKNQPVSSFSPSTSDALSFHPQYWPFIDGLRAVSILFVVAAHVELPGLAGGFVGVDIFFVISGFLIIGQILYGLEEGKFSFVQFWARRALRIAPPVIVMLAVCSVLAPFILVLPRQFDEFGKQLSYSAVMAVNHYFLDRQNYFDTDAIYKPLLHMWSLAVEEQFYLIAPVLIWGAYECVRRRGGHKLFIVAIVTALATLAACIILTTPTKNLAFYAAPLRAWEFIAGGMVWRFASTIRVLSKHCLEALSVAGLTAILCSLIMFGDQPYPSYLALVPVLGAFLIISTGVCQPNLWSSRLLSNRLMIAVGLVSYGWYLWHWPLLSFLRIANFGRKDLLYDISAVSIAFILAVLSYRLVERPFQQVRRWQLSNRANQVVIVMTLVACGAVAASGAVYRWQIARAVEQSIPRQMQPTKDVKVAARDPCWMKSPQELSQECIMQLGNKRIALLVGDSHARMMYPPVKTATDAQGLGLITLWRGGCLPLLDGNAETSIGSTECNEFFAQGLKTISDKLKGPIYTVVVGGYWTRAINSQTLAEFIGAEKPADFDNQWRRSVKVTVGLQKLLAVLRSMQAERILILGPSAEFVYSPVDCIVRSDRYRRDRQFCAVDRGLLSAWLSPAVTALKTVEKTNSNAVFIDLSQVFCSATICRPNSGDTLLYTDHHHVSAEGAMRLFAETSAARELKRLPAMGDKPRVLNVGGAAQPSPVQ